MCVKCKDNTCNGSHCKALPTGLRGPRGHEGLQGKQGPIGPQGIQGAQGIQGIQGIQGRSIQGLKGNQGPQGTSGASGILGSQGVQGVQGPTGGILEDTGWVDLLGFDFYDSTAPSVVKKPQARRIGKVIYFKGTLMIPLIDGKGGVLDWKYGSTVDTYTKDPTTSALITAVTPYQGVGGVKLASNSNGSLQFNSQISGGGFAAASVLDPIVWNPSMGLIDDTYQNPAGWKLAQRPIITGTASSMLTTFFSITINANGILTVGLPKDAEEAWIQSNDASYYTSPLNYLISNVVLNQKVPRFTDNTNNTPLNKIHSNLIAGLQNLQQFFESSQTYKYSCNAGTEEQIGGFSVRLDGLTAFLAP
jgi:hypothetical protein